MESFRHALQNEPFRRQPRQGNDLHHQLRRRGWHRLETHPEILGVADRERSKRRRRFGLTWENSRAPGNVKRRPESWWPDALRILLGPIALIASAVICTFLLIHWIDRPVSNGGISAPAPSGNESVSAPPLQQAQVGSKAKADAVLSELMAFVNDVDHSARSTRVFEKENILRKLLSYYAPGSHSLPKRIINPSVTGLDFKGRELLLAAFFDESGRQWPAPFEWDRDRYRLHWEVMTAYGAVSCRALIQNRTSGTHEIRLKLYIPEDGLSEHPDGLHIFGLASHPDQDQPFGLFIQKGSDVHRAIIEMSRKGDVPALVDVEWVRDNDEYPTLTRWTHSDWIQ